MIDFNEMLTIVLCLSFEVTYCGRQLGLIDGNVFDYQLEASTSKDANHLPKFGRLYWPSNSWCASYTDTNPWFMVIRFIQQRKHKIQLFILIRIKFSHCKW